MVNKAVDRSGGGLLTGIPKTTAGRIIPTSFSDDTNLEILATEIHFNNHKFIIVNLYAPQGFDIQQAKSFFESFSIPVIIFGYFNLHYPMWGSNNSIYLSNSFVDWLQNSNFVMLNTSNPTYTSYTGTNSLPDVTLCSTSIYHQVDCFVSDSTFESDHNPVITTSSLLGQTSKTIKTIDWNSIMKNTSEILSSTNSDLHDVMRKVSGIIKQNTKHSALPGIFSSTDIPEQWKHSIIVAVPKPNKDKSKINSYRPIALTFVCSKIFERILVQRITHNLIVNKKIPSYIYGFLPLRGNQLGIHTAITEAHHQKNYFIGINLDIKSAYDSVYIDGLVLKCLQLGITGHLSKFIHQFLHDRTQQIRWRNSLSDTKVIQKGLAQGSALFPVMLAIFMFDFFETLDEGFKCSIFADDIFIYCSYRSLEYIEKKLQNTMDNVYKWCTYWKLSISPEKSAIADLSKRRLLSTPRISYAGSPLPWKDSIKYLGIIFSKTNQNGAIVKNLRAKALEKINALKTIAYKSYGLRTKDLVCITNNGICSLFYYSCAITNKLSQTHFKICDTIQTIALRVALGLPKHCLAENFGKGNSL
ncbi:RNA-directed DNA polymerase from mobile element jockey [Araneus ventricosus]|uniref:RNA-directed DNA polymerase from mobile element jockey n=1 Tax=Araneus ventricosus TaxID=182803 RepID=A0A4Y2ALG7_ARAVE|nr:RNA-directed DNA polymerase from mobile element jockey [Araneus ventricosus]